MPIRIMELKYQELERFFLNEGFFNQRRWLLSPDPFVISAEEGARLMRLGLIFMRFQDACNRIYRRSAKGELAPWIANLLDAGKPEWMVQYQRKQAFSEQRSRVIRPDLLWGGGEGAKRAFALTELDPVPGGMGVTASLARLYGAAGHSVLGGQDGIVEGFASLFPAEGGRVLISEESMDYKPEMSWLVRQLKGVYIQNAESDLGDEGAVYRFFELFDWEQISAIKKLANRGQVTPPIKAFQEEKLWLALLWSPALKDVWREELRGSHLNTLQQLVPFSWVLDPQKLPPHAVLPRLEAHSWEEVGRLSQKKRQLVLKISGFSERAWGSRGVVIGHDEPQKQWESSVQDALSEFQTNPWVMQEFKPSVQVSHRYYSPENGEIRKMNGRVRLCPYYFLSSEGAVSLGGCLATIVSADKKKVHGMEDAILVPVSIGEP